MKRQVQTILSLLVAQFLLGMGLNVMGEVSASSSYVMKASHFVLLVLHILVAIVLVAAVTRLWTHRLTLSESSLKALQRGSYALGLAFLSGLLTVFTPWEELFSFVMAAGFIG